MMEKIIFGRYIPAASLLHRMDPRAKILFVFFYIITVFLANNAITYTILGIFTIICVLLSDISIKFIFSGLKFLIWLILFTFLMHIIFTKEGDIIFDLGLIQVYENGLRQAIFISLRFVYLILVTTLLTLTTTPIEITDGIESLLHPLKKIKFPVHELALMMSIALRFIPTLMQETDKIMKAQAARGVEFSSGPLKERMKSVVPLLIPLFVNSFKRAEDLAIAMEARGYKGGEGRTKFRLLKWSVTDSLSFIFLAGIVIILIIFRS
jgi:energy-coupling factor transport system permease protein